MRLLACLYYSKSKSVFIAGSQVYAYSFRQCLVPHPMHFLHFLLSQMLWKISVINVHFNGSPFEMYRAFLVTFSSSPNLRSQFDVWLLTFLTYLDAPMSG